MLTGVYQSAAILATGILYYVMDVWLMHRYDSLREGSSRHWGYTAIVLVIMIFTTVQPIVWPGLGVHTDAWWGLLIQILGLMPIVGGLVLQWWARVHLRQFFYEGVELQPGHCLVESGPYAYIRHPIYISFFMLAIGSLLINPALPMLLGVVYAFALFLPMSTREEKLLAENLPGYADYMARTSRFLPRLRKHSGGKRSWT